MKSFRLIILIGSCLLISNMLVYGDCGNNNKGGADDPSCGCATCPGDPFNPFTGNESRAIEELQIWGGVGEHQLKWMRYGNSRGFASKNELGMAHWWNFSYNYSMSDRGLNSITGQPQLFIHYPEGGSNVFARDAGDPSLWLPLPGIGKRLFQQGNNFYLQMPDGFRYRFEKLMSSPGKYYYQLQDFRDNFQNLYTLTYDRKRRLERITEPAGRYLQISYTSMPGVANLISGVSSSDGRSIQYNYDVYDDGIRKWVRLVSVNYGDGTQAKYTYSQSEPGAHPLLEHAIDPRYTGKNVNMIFKYNNAVASGFISEEINGVTGKVMVTLITSGNHRRVCYANGRMEHYLMPDSLLGRLKEYTDGLGRKTVYEFDMAGDGFIKSEKDPFGRITTYKRTIYSSPIEITHPDGSKESWTRDGLDRILSYTDNLGRSTFYERDAQHRLIKITYPDGTNEQFTYNSFGQILIHTLKNGGVEYNVYNTRGLKTSMTGALGNITVYTYDGADRLAAITDARNNTTRYEYIERGLLARLINPDNSFQTYTYDEFGNQTGATNELGNSWTSNYDEFKRLVSLRDPLNRITKYDYELAGGVCGCQHDNNTPTLITLPSGRMIKMEYDVEWKLLRKTEGAGSSDDATTSYEYDLTGNLVVMIDPRGKGWLYEYDVRNRPIATTDPLGQTTRQNYDAIGNIIALIRPDGGVTNYTYDNMNRLIKTSDPLAQVTRMVYDIEGNLSELIDAKNNSYRYEYDLLDRETKMIYPGGSFEGYSYDAVGNVNVYTNRSGITRTYSYDNRNRRLQSNWSDATPDINTTYDVAGRTLTMSSNISTLAYTYDNANALISETQNIENGGGKTVSYTYNQDGLLNTLSYPVGNVINYNYTGRNQVSSLMSNGTAVVNYTYDLNGNRIIKALQNETITDYSHDNTNRLLSLNNQHAGISFARFEYGYDNANRRTFVKRDGGKGDVYRYDATDQVIQVHYEVTNPDATPSAPLRTTCRIA